MVEKKALKLVSQLDCSVNFVTKAPVGYFESRYVSRPYKDHFIVYLSSQSGCAKACRMCHLTATKQTKAVDATMTNYVDQACDVFDHWEGLPEKLQREVHFNFMARGEPLANRNMLNQGATILRVLGNEAELRDLTPRFLISTIMPRNFIDRELDEVFHERSFYLPEIYYSIYSVEADFRKKWLPQAMDPSMALKKLKRWQQATGKKPKIHYAFIKGENDNPDSVRRVMDLVDSHDLEVDVNIVRYNPPTPDSQEADEAVIERNAELFAAQWQTSKVQVIPRVGLDVMASCGVFFSG